MAPLCSFLTTAVKMSTVTFHLSGLQQITWYEPNICEDANKLYYNSLFGLKSFRFNMFFKSSFSYIKHHCIFGPAVTDGTTCRQNGLTPKCCINCVLGNMLTAVYCSIFNDVSVPFLDAQQGESCTELKQTSHLLT